MPQFDIEGARKAGYSEDEILSHLTQSRKFDIEGARASGYSNDEIIQHLSGAAPTAGFQVGDSSFKPGPLGQVMTSVQSALAAPFIAARHPLETAKGMAMAPVEQGRKALEEFKAGDYGSAVARGLALTTPGLGPTAINLVEKATTGERPWEAAADAALMALPGVLPKSVRLPPIVRNMNNPVEQAALGSIAGRVPMTVGQATGNRLISRVEQGLENFPGSSAKMQEFFGQQKEALAREGSRIAGRVGGVRTNPFGAGQAVQQRLQQRITRLKGQADNLYSQIRRETAANKQTIQTGTQQSKILDATGNPITVPVMTTLETPVPLGPLRQQLAPIYEDLTRAMPEARRAASPAFRALQDLMTSDQVAMNAMDFDRSLSAIKSIVRDGSSPYLTSKSQGIAKQIVSNGEAFLRDALTGAGPQTANKLAVARKTVKAYYDTADLLGDLSDEPAALYHNLTTGGDRVVNMLSELQKVAPREMNTVARTYLEGMMERGSREGGFGGAAGILRDWNKLGPETKHLLFGKQADDVDRFMLAAKRLERNENPSGTAKMVLALGNLGIVGDSLLQVFAGDPMGAIRGPAVAGAARTLAQVLTSPGGAARLTTAIRVPLSTPARAIPTGAVINLNLPGMEPEP